MKQYRIEITHTDGTQDVCTGRYTLEDNCLTVKSGPYIGVYPLVNIRSLVLEEK